jgi:predicted SAM-dependent methyltransferase
MIKVNLGCGNRFLEDWVNIDFVSQNDNVIQYDLRNGIPLDDSSADVIYHSHILEHFTKDEAIFFLTECYRVLKKDGIIRISIPDLELIARQYLTMLTFVQEDENELTIANYNWAIIELIDQLVREKSGGEMLKYWMQKDLVNENLLATRLGHEFTAWRKKHVEHLIDIPKSEDAIFIRDTKSIFQKLAYAWKKYWLSKWQIKEVDLEIGAFRNFGEVHKWMYDSYSLKSLLSNIGFSSVRNVTALDSMIVNWEKESILDIENDVKRKPDSLYMEAIKSVK